jgi:hypothetical protein
MLEILLCVAYAVLYGLFGYLFILALQWLLAKIPGLAPLPGEAMQVIQAIIAVLIFIMLILCIFGGGLGRFDLFHLHQHPPL